MSYRQQYRVLQAAVQSTAGSSTGYCRQQYRVLQAAVQGTAGCSTGYCIAACTVLYMLQG